MRRVADCVEEAFFADAPACEDVSAAFMSLHGMGKSLRAALVRIGNGLYGGGEGPEMWTLAACHELAQTALLVSDDVMDNSDLRRGRPAMHVQLAKTRAGQMPQHLTWLMGIYGLLLPYEAMAGQNAYGGRLGPVVGEFAASMLKTVLGQMRDLVQGGIASLCPAAVLDNYRLKTSHYTIIGPLRSGALLAASPEQTQWILPFGESFGIAFQIIDDLLPFISTTGEAGKSAMSDAQEGKPTWVICRALELAGPDERARILALYGNRDMDQAQFDELCSLVKGCGAHTEAAALAEDLLGQSLDILHAQDGLNGECVRLLEGMAAFIALRRR